MYDETINFKKYGYCKVESVISKELSDFITQYSLFDEMQDFSSESMQGKSQVPNAHSKYADPAMESMLLILHPIIEQYTELELFPTYSFYRVYRNGDNLKIHTDRPSCEISATVCFNYSYDDNEYNWPIYMNKNPIVLSPGDIAIYRGCDIEHYRDSFDPQDDGWQVQGFFHYVDSNGINRDYKFDKRSSIGEHTSFKNRFFSNKHYIEYTK